MIFFWSRSKNCDFFFIDFFLIQSKNLRVLSYEHFKFFIVRLDGWVVGINLVYWFILNLRMLTSRMCSFQIWAQKVFLRLLDKNYFLFSFPFWNYNFCDFYFSLILASVLFLRLVKLHFGKKIKPKIARNSLTRAHKGVLI